MAWPKGKKRGPMSNATRDRIAFRKLEQYSDPLYRAAHIAVIKNSWKSGALHKRSLNDPMRKRRMQICVSEADWQYIHWISYVDGTSVATVIRDFITKDRVKAETDAKQNDFVPSWLLPKDMW